MATDIEKKQDGGLRLGHGLALVAVGAVGLIVAFVVLSTIVGFLWGILKIIIVIAVVVVLWRLLRRL